VKGHDHHPSYEPDAIVDEAMAAGLDGSDRLTFSVKMFLSELLSVKADLERELERELLDCVVYGVPAHYVGALGVRAGYWTTRRARAARDAEAPALGRGRPHIALRRGRDGLAAASAASQQGEYNGDDTEGDPDSVHQ
jgi:hypothetical protein